MATKVAEKSVQIEVKKLEKSSFKLTIIGDTPLIVHAWSTKAKKQMIKKMMGLPVIRESKNPYEDFLKSMYRFEDGNYGFPVVGLKEALATATIDMQNVTKTQIYRNVFITGRRGFQQAAFADLLSPMELGEVFSPNAPVMREDPVRLSGPGRTPDLRYRAELWPWAMVCNVGFIADFISAENLYNLIEKAGFTIGLGEWRQDKGGNYGSFHLATEGEKKEVAGWKKAGPKEPPVIDVEFWKEELRKDSRVPVTVTEEEEGEVTQ